MQNVYPSQLQLLCSGTATDFLAEIGQKCKFVYKTTRLRPQQLVNSEGTAAVGSEHIHNKRVADKRRKRYNNILECSSCYYSKRPI